MCKSLLSYIGGKSKAISRLRKYIPDNADIIVSPFFGGGSFELSLAAEGRTVIGYDADERVVNFRNIFQERQTDFVNFVNEHVNKVRDVWVDPEKKLFKWIYNNHDTHDCPIERAGWLRFLSKVSRDVKLCEEGFTKPVKFTQLLKEIEKPLPKNISVKHQHWETRFLSHPDEFMFIDPTYFKIKRKCEYYRFHKEFDHVLLRDWLAYRTGGFLLTYENSEGIRELYRNFQIENEAWHQSINTTSELVKETIILPTSTIG